jgi:ADP-ribose pyrophosphatase YjhB (NUDIX family)
MDRQDRSRWGSLRRSTEPLLRRAMHAYWRFSRGLTLGVRAVVLDPQARVFLVRHSYVAGWHLPGGGVEVGETLTEALARELKEEGNIEYDGEPPLLGVYFNRRASRRDHVAVFVIRAFRQPTPPVPNHEIVAHGFFPPDALPADTSAGTRARIAEALRGVPRAAVW